MQHQSRQKTPSGRLGLAEYVTSRQRESLASISNRSKKAGCRSKTLKSLHSRPVLILVCALVVVECICVLAELMVDLQAIRFRFENEEAELAKFVDFLKTSYPDEFKSFKGKSFESVFSKLRESMALHKVFPHPDDPIITPGNNTNNINNNNNNNRNCTCNTPVINSRHTERRQLLSNNDHVTLHSAFKSDRTANSVVAVQRTTTTPTAVETPPSGLRAKKNLFHQINNANNSRNSSHSHSSNSSISSNSRLNSHTVHNKKHKTHLSVDKTMNNTSNHTNQDTNIKNYKNNYNDTSTNSQSSENSSSSSSSLNIINSSFSEISSSSSIINSSSSTINSSSISNSSSSYNSEITSTSSTGRPEESRISKRDITRKVPQRVFKRGQNKEDEYVAKGADNRTVYKDLSQLSSRVESGLPHVSEYDSRKARLQLEETRLHSGNSTEPPLFVLHINNIKESFYLFGHYVGKENDSRNYRKEAQYYEDEYERVHHISQGIHIGSIVILFIMVVETFIKLCCMRVKFFKKKFEVFDAFIVMASFALDFVFLDSQWYETGKDASTVLVLLLPWRVVRIVNSFLMTVNRKHHIEIMTVRKSKKKADMKIIKLQALINEITRDVELLVALSRSRGAPEHEITACLYGKGRRGVAMSAISSFASLMLISTLGRSDVAGDTDDDLYGHALEEAMKEDQDDNDDTANGILMEEDEEDDDDDDDEEEDEEDGDDDDDDDDDDNDDDLESGRRSSGSSAIDDNLSCRRAIRMARNKMAAAAAAAADVAGQSCTASTSYARRNTIPQPGIATTTRNSMLYYINNGYALHEPDDSEMERRPSLPSTNSVHSLPGLPTSDTFLSFDVATQVTYL